MEISHGSAEIILSFELIFYILILVTTWCHKYMSWWKNPIPPHTLINSTTTVFSITKNQYWWTWVILSINDLSKVIMFRFPIKGKMKETNKITVSQWWYWYRKTWIFISIYLFLQHMTISINHYNMQMIIHYTINSMFFYITHI